MATEGKRSCRCSAKGLKKGAGNAICRMVQGEMEKLPETSFQEGAIVDSRENLTRPESPPGLPQSSRRLSFERRGGRGVKMMRSVWNKIIGSGPAARRSESNSSNTKAQIGFTWLHIEVWFAT